MASQFSGWAEQSKEPEKIREQIRQWKAGMEEANRLDLEEALRRSPAERLAALQVFLRGNARYGLALEKPEDRRHLVPYHEIQERFLARYSKRLGSH